MLVSVLATPLGPAGQFVLPLTCREMLRERTRLPDPPPARPPAVPVTTGHAATALSVIRTIEQVLATCGRKWAGEHGVGVGSVGEASTRAALHLLGPPRRLTLVDLPGNRARMAAVADDQRARHPELDVAFSSADDAEDGRSPQASLVVGASRVPDILRVSGLRPGVVVDDSVPNCLDVATAQRRAAVAGDLVFTNGGYLSFARSYDIVRVRHNAAGTPRPNPAHTSSTTMIASCIGAPLLMAHDPAPPPPTGPGAAPLSCKGRAPAVRATPAASELHTRSWGRVLAGKVIIPAMGKA